VIDAENVQLGIVETFEAMRMAREQGLDLVEVSPTEKPPVCRIMDYGKYKYQQKKKQKERHSHEIVTKEIRLRPKTDDNDKKIKLNHALRFLDEGCKVQFTMLFRGRERAHKEMGYEIFQGILSALGERVKIEREPRTEGSRMIMIVSPAKK
jgi:translation initiation factor IF-3